ncbi:MAG: hypothetical protein ACR2P1_12565 [Pseudomonadales bacterium]
MPLVGAAETVEKVKARSTVQDLGYGVMLYEYFQHNYLQALTELEVERKRGGIQGHSSHPDLMEGGIKLSYGMDRSAEEIFNRLLADYKDPAVRDQAWFYLGKIAYQRAEFERSANSFDKINDDLPTNLRDEFLFLTSNLLINARQLDRARQRIDKLDSESPWQPYARFNLGVAYASENADQGNTSQQATAAFAKLDEYSNDSDELKALNDRANLAAGYVLLRGGHQADAIEAFKSVRLQGPYASQAMLGYGWAAAELKDYKLALTPWQRLSEQSLISPSVQESYLAIPFAYEQLGAERQALEEFERSAAAYEIELQRIDRALATLKDADIIKLFVREMGAEASNWIVTGNDLDVKPQTPYLAHLIAQHKFQSGLMDLRDAYAMQANLQRWEDKVATFSYAVESYQIARDEKRTGTDQRALEQVSELKQQYDQLSTRVAAIEKAEAVLALLPNEEQAKVRKLAAVQTMLSDAQSGGADIAEEQQRLNMLRGVLLWQAAERYPENLRAAKKALSESKVTLDKASATKAQVQNLLVTSDTQSAQKRVRSGQLQLQAARAQSEKTIVAARRYLAELASAELGKQRLNIAAYLSQARLAIARLYDTGTRRALESSGGGEQ